MKTRLFTPLSLVLAVALLASSGHAAASPQGGAILHLPLILRAFDCPTTSGNTYSQGIAYQWDSDNPVRPAALHADKNIGLRGYNLNTTEFKGFVNYGSDDPTRPPQFGTLFEPDRIPPFSNVYRIYRWNFGTPPDPGTRGEEETNPSVTVLGLQTTSGEVLQVPDSGYDIGGGMEVIVLFADADTIAMKYTREDSVQPNGYLVHVDNICTDPNLLALYNTLDTGARYVPCGGFGCSSYNLVNLPSGQVFGSARDTEIRVAIVDSGTTLDPRSCFEFWVWQFPGGGACP